MSWDIEPLREMSARVIERSERLDESLLRVCNMLASSNWGQTEEVCQIIEELTETREIVLSYNALKKALVDIFQYNYKTGE